jgi:hypothetical protein
MKRISVFLIENALGSTTDPTTVPSKSKEAPTPPEGWPSVWHHRCSERRCEHPNPPQVATGVYNCLGAHPYIRGAKCPGTYFVNKQSAFEATQYYARLRKNEERRLVKAKELHQEIVRGHNMEALQASARDPIYGGAARRHLELVQLQELNRRKEERGLISPLIGSDRAKPLPPSPSQNNITPVWHRTLRSPLRRARVYDIGSGHKEA